MMKSANTLKIFGSVLASCSFIFSPAFANDEAPVDNREVEIAVTGDDSFVEETNQGEETKRAWLNNKGHFYPIMSAEIEEQIVLQQQEQSTETTQEQPADQADEKNVKSSSLFTKGYEEDCTIPSLAYPGVFHFWINCPTDWSWFMLEDESIWHIAYEDRTKIQNWFAGYALVLRPNNWWDSDPYYQYQLYNTVTKQTVQVNIDSINGPLMNGPYSRYIYGFINNGHEVQLTDGSLWTVKPNERRSMTRWVAGDAVYIGINNDWFTGRYEYILINSAAGNWVRVDWKH